MMPSVCLSVMQAQWGINLPWDSQRWSRWGGWLGWVIGLDISADGQFLYSVSAADDAISWFEINATDGTLNYLGMLRDGVDGVDGLNEARTVSLSADGAHVYATAISDDAVSWFERNASTGSLTYGGRIRNGVDGVTANGPIDVKISVMVIMLM